MKNNLCTNSDPTLSHEVREERQNHELHSYNLPNSGRMMRKHTDIFLLPGAQPSIHNLDILEGFTRCCL